MTPTRELAGSRIVAEHLDRTPCATDQSQHQLHQCGLAGAVVTDQRNHLALGEVKRNINYGRDSAVMFRDAGDTHGRSHGATSPKLRRTGGDISGWLSTTPPGSNAGNCA